MRAVSFWFVCASLQRQQCSYCQSDLVHIYAHACCHTYLLVCNFEKLGIPQLTFGVGILDIAPLMLLSIHCTNLNRIYECIQTHKGTARWERKREMEGGRGRERDNHTTARKSSPTHNHKPAEPCCEAFGSPFANPQTLLLCPVENKTSYRAIFKVNIWARSAVWHVH